MDAIVHVLRDIRAGAYRPSAPIVDGLAEALKLLLTASAEGADVYYTLYETGAVMRIPKGGGDAGVFAPATKPRCLAIDDANVYWVNDDHVGGGLMRAAKDGGTPVTIPTGRGAGGHRYVAVDDTYVYWAQYSRLYRAPK